MSVCGILWFKDPLENHLWTLSCLWNVHYSICGNCLSTRGQRHGPMMGSEDLKIQYYVTLQYHRCIAVACTGTGYSKDLKILYHTSTG